MFQELKNSNKKSMEFLGTNLSNYEDEQFENYKQNWAHFFNFWGT